MDRRVIDGDKHDLRFKDPRGVVVGLVAKGLGRKVTKNSFIKTAVMIEFFLESAAFYFIHYGSY